MNSGCKLSNFLWFFLCPSLVITGKVTSTEDFVIITKAFNIAKMDKAINWFQRGLGAKINVVEISGDHAWITYVNTPVSVISYFLWSKKILRTSTHGLLNTWTDNFFFLWPYRGQSYYQYLKKNSISFRLFTPMITKNGAKVLHKSMSQS